MCSQFLSFSNSPSPCLCFSFLSSSLNKNSISDSCTRWEKCGALPTARSVIASEPQWGLEPPLPALLTSGNLDLSLCVRLWLLQLQINGAFDLLFVWKQRAACDPAPLCPTHPAHSLKKLLFVRVCNMCVHAFDSCICVEHPSLKSTEITVGRVSEGGFSNQPNPFFGWVGGWVGVGSCCIYCA